MAVENKFAICYSECYKVFEAHSVTEFCDGLKNLLCCCCDMRPKSIHDDEKPNQFLDKMPRFFQGPSRLLTKAQAKKTILLHLYLHQKYQEPSANQCVPFSIDGSKNCFGTIAVNDWTVRETNDPTSMVIARAQGLHTGCNQRKEEWNSSFNMVFEDEMYSGSSLEVHGMWGTNTNSRFEWTIVGGTNKFRLAQGIIVGNINRHDDGLRVFELNIHVLFCDIHIPTFDPPVQPVFN